MADDLDIYHEQLAQEYLDHVASCASKVEMINDEIQQLRSQLSLSGVDYHEHVNGGSVNKDAIPNGVAKMLDLIDEYTTKQVEMLDEQRELMSIIMRLDKTEAVVVKERWLNNKQWEQVAYMLGYSFPGIMGVRRRTLQHVYKEMPIEWRENVRAV